MTQPAQITQLTKKDPIDTNDSTGRNDPTDTNDPTHPNVPTGTNDPTDTI